MKFFVHTLVLSTAFVLAGQLAFGQPEPYYKLPQERTEKGVKTFPNLKPALTKFYLRGEGGFLLQGSTLSDNFNGQLTPNSPINVNWGASLGYNYRDRWLAEIGYANTPLQLNSLFRLNPSAVPIVEVYELHGVSVRYQHSVLVVDRIARSTRLFVGGGLLLNTNGKAAEISNSSASFLRRFGQSAADTVRLAESTFLSATPFLGEVSVELRGKVVEGLEIGVYTKLLSSFDRPMKTNFSYQINDAPLNQTTHVISPLAFRFGVSVHYNFGIITKYESDFE